MPIPAMEGIIERRILVNYRADPEVLARLLPPPLRPQTVQGWGVAGICLIRLGAVRPRGLPAWVGHRSENAAHRIAVVWEDGGQEQTGVFIPRRDSSSRLNSLLGGRLFPGTHHRASFHVKEEGPRVRVAMQSADGAAALHVAGQVAHAFPPDSLFSSLDDASCFFEKGAMGFSPPARGSSLEALELRTHHWKVRSLELSELGSHFFGDPQRFPPGSVHFDHALLMRDIPHEWHAHAPLACGL